MDILVNNAGMEIHNAFLDYTEQQFDWVIGVDRKGAFFCAQAAAREMVKSKTAGRIINVSSVHEDIAMPNNSPSTRSQSRPIVLAFLVIWPQATKSAQVSA